MMSRVADLRPERPSKQTDSYTNECNVCRAICTQEWNVAQDCGRTGLRQHSWSATVHNVHLFSGYIMQVGKDAGEAS